MIKIVKLPRTDTPLFLQKHDARRLVAVHAVFRDGQLIPRLDFLITPCQIFLIQGKSRFGRRLRYYWRWSHLGNRRKGWPSGGGVFLDETKLGEPQISFHLQKLAEAKGNTAFQLAMLIKLFATVNQYCRGCARRQ